jgi:hypothetical protein
VHTFNSLSRSLAEDQRLMGHKAMLEYKTGIANLDVSKKPVLVVRERRLEKPPMGKPPKRPNPSTGEPMIKRAPIGPGRNGGPPEDTRTETPSPAVAPLVPPRPPRVLN